MQFSLRVMVFIVPICVAAIALVARPWAEPTFSHRDYVAQDPRSHQYRYCVVRRKEWTGSVVPWNIVISPDPPDFATRAGGTDLGDHQTTLDIAADKVYLRGAIVSSFPHPCVVLIDRQGKRQETVPLTDAEREQLLCKKPEEWLSLPFWKSKVEDRLFAL